jgi:shikimate dehydrogenase
MGISYHFVSRNPGPGVMTYADLTEETIRKYRLIINASPAGMYPRLDSYPPLAYGALSGEYFLFDLVYNPAETIFLQKGREQGCVIQNGAEMLQIQAEESWSIWNRR